MQTHATAGASAGRLPAGPAWLPKGLTVLLATAVLVTGATGLFQYVRTYWLYRGFAPPNQPAVVRVRRHGRSRLVRVTRGTEKTIYVRSPALGGRRELVDVYLPPGYFQHPRQRYPVYYLLHGSPGAPTNFFHVADIEVAEDLLVAKGLMKPMIIVAPTGGPSFFSDTEWANGVRKNTGWETYVVRDLVEVVQHDFRAIPSGRYRIVGGLSMGGYGALDMAIHHPGEFDVVESWSGYMWADRVPGVFGAHPKRSMMLYDSPAFEVRRVAKRLRADHVFIWFYSGRRDPLRFQNERFATELQALHIGHSFLLEPGGHDWRLWRSMTPSALLVASQHLPPLPTPQAASPYRLADGAERA